ncbi:hypothetical protein BJV78DRAFT_463131 [Lactifluus subvellereus]|nr:hypothetical protein BJV78DRAFT_463131 [Lactifluus subvellereus]
MADWRDPTRVAADYSSFSLASQVSSDQALRHSRPRQACPCLGWLVHVGKPTRLRFGSHCPISPDTSWEFVIHLDYEYSVFTGKRKLTRTFPLYLGCRLCPLIVITMKFLDFEHTSKINCRVWKLLTPALLDGKGRLSHT